MVVVVVVVEQRGQHAAGAGGVRRARTGRTPAGEPDQRRTLTRQPAESVAVRELCCPVETTSRQQLHAATARFIRGPRARPPGAFHPRPPPPPATAARCRRRSGSPTATGGVRSQHQPTT